MATNKALRIYKLYERPGGPSPSQDNYGRPMKTIYHVAAASVKQAVLLAARKEWSKDGGPGLVEYADNDGQWHRADGSTSWSQSYLHKQIFTDKLRKQRGTP
jgi:hypothetical protein